GARRFLDVRAPDPGRVHRSVRDLSLLAAAGLDPGKPVFRRWELPNASARDVVVPVQPFTLLHCSVTDYGRDKEWPPERWAALARALRAAGRTPLALWTPADRPRVAEIVAAADGALDWAPATPSLPALMTLCDAAELLIGTDSGPVHLAATRGTPVLALLGPTDPVLYAPPGDHVRVIYPGAPHEAPPPRDRSQRSPWMERISVEAVLKAALAPQVTARAD
ncbi:MAG: glycosyltransferase family 9 protein, partial [Chloroflexota bacterium]